MRALANQIIVFYRQATEENDQANEERRKYYDELKNGRLGYAASHAIFLMKYKNEPWFHIEDLKPFINKMFNLSQYKPDKQLYELYEKASPEYNEYIKKEMIDTLINHRLNDGTRKLNLEWYFAIEEIANGVDDPDLRKLQVKLIKYLFNRFENDKTEGGAADEVIELINDSKYFDKNILRSILRKMNPKEFSYWAPTHFRPADIMKKEELNKTDILSLLSQFPITYRTFHYIISKSTTSAKDFLRRILYRSRNDQKIFILDDSMTPVDEVYKTINLTDQDIIDLIELEQLSDENTQKWSKIFSDYKIVPLRGFTSLQFKGHMDLDNYQLDQNKADDNKISDEEYQLSFSIVMSSMGSSPKAIYQFLKKCRENIKNNHQDLQKLIEKARAWFSGGSGGPLSTWIKSLKEIDPEFYAFARNYVGNLAVIGAMDIYEIVLLDQEGILTAEEMRSVLNRTLKSLQEESVPETSQSAQDMQTLILSKSLNSKLVRRLLREYVPWLFAVEYAESQYEDGPSLMGETKIRQQKFDQKFLNKEEYTQDDAVYLMDYLRSASIPYAQFKRIVGATNTVGQNTLRRGLYVVQSKLDDFEHAQRFILDEVLQPVNAEYKVISIEPQALMGRWAGAELGEAKFKWANAFAEMGVLPYGDTF